MIGTRPVIAWMMLIGLAVTLPFVFLTGVPAGLDWASVGWMAASGMGNVFGLLIVYAALRVGKVGVVAPIVATEGAIAAIIAALFGESIAPITAFLLLLVVVGVVIAAVAPDPVPVEDERPLRAALLATASALVFGVGLFSIGHLSGVLPMAWLLLPARLIGVVVIAIPLIISGKLVLTKKAFPLVTAAALAEVVGFAAYSIGAQHSVAITAVMSSQFAPIAAVAAYFLFGEKLGKLQILGVAVIVVGVSMLSLVPYLS